MAYHKLKINSIQSLTSEASAIGFEVPSSIKDLFEYHSGQYINLKATIKGGGGSQVLFFVFSA